MGGIEKFRFVSYNKTERKDTNASKHTLILQNRKGSCHDGISDRSMD